MLERIANYIRELKQTTNQYLWLEVAIIDLANLADNTTLLALQSRLQALEGGEPVAPRTSAAPVQHSPVSVPQSEPIRPVMPQSEQKPAPQPQQIAQPEPKPEPVSVASNDMASLWNALVKQVNSPSAQALLRLANPVKIAPDEVIITFKQEIFVKQANDEAKKQVLRDAADRLFNTPGTPVTIRLPQSGDAQLPKPQAAPSEPQAPTKQIIKPVVQTPQKEPPKPVQEVSVADNSFDEEEKEVSKPQNQPPAEQKSENYAGSDQTKMIMDLFDGKFI